MLKPADIFKNHARLLKIFVFLVVLAFYASFVIVKIDFSALDNDAGLYISDGRLIAQQHNFFRTNLYTYVAEAQNFPVLNHHWLSSVVFYFVSHHFGFIGLSLLKTVVLLSFFILLFRVALKKGNFWLTALGSLPTILILANRVRIRPEMFSYLFIALFLYWLVDLERHPQRKRVFWLILVQMLWVNCHVFFFVGLALVGGFLLEKIITALPKKRSEIFSIVGWRSVKNNLLVRKLFFLFSCLVTVSFINPNGVWGVLAPFISHNYPSLRISENQPLFDLQTSFVAWNFFGSPYVWMILIFVVSIFFNLKREPIFWLLAGVGSAVAGLVYIRLTTLFAIIFLPAVVYNFNDILNHLKIKLTEKRPKLARWLGRFSVVFVVMIFVGQFYYTQAANAQRGYGTDWGFGLSENSGDAGKFFKEQGIKGPIFNDYDIGGYILYYLFPKEKVFVDNNGADSYPLSFFDNIFFPAYSEEGGWQDVQNMYKLNAIFISLRDASPLVGNFLWRRLQDPDWALVYADPYAVILVKNNTDNQELIKKFHITKENIMEKLKPMLASDNTMNKIIAGRLLYLSGREDLSTSVLKKVAAKYPKNSWVWLYMGSIKASKNDPASLISAVLFLENAVSMGGKDAETYTWLGLAYFKLGKFDKAELALRQALRLSPERGDALNYLQQLQNYLLQK